MDEHCPSYSDPRDEYLKYVVKNQLRSRMSALRTGLPRKARQDYSEAMCNHILQLSCYKQARTIIGYCPIKKEVDPKLVIQTAFKDEKTIGFPRVNKQNGLLSLHSWSIGDSLSKSDMGVKEPDISAPLLELSEIDLILVPALAIDARGYRIGYGKGYYDRLLALIPDATTIAIVYDFQLVIEVPVTDGDIPLSMVVTDRRILHSKRPEEEKIG